MELLTVKLEPIQGWAEEECEPSDIDKPQKRQGASAFWFVPFSILSLGFRRFKKSS
ncbi:hypothetical protein [Paraglaciecola sp. L3A3]|uniref:hypothetical protein n=1 Tax=Paraglaciecola sp. L3A3 TaxID=2686358 RepID=UPI00131B5C5A|nr:hypothetical protein [Paraglaciecola sp. L3A3]